MKAVQKEKFLFLYANEYGGLNPSQQEGVTALLSFLEGDDNIADLRHAAYMLATVKHECAGSWQPIEEFGHGRGKKYGLPDPQTQQVYYGRGYVQLTWRDNYETVGKHFGLDLIHEPQLVLRPEVAYRIMSYGMRTGAFTGVGLPRFINAEKCDYINARKIINVLDCAEKIAGYAGTLERILNESQEEA